MVTFAARSGIAPYNVPVGGGTPWWVGGHPSTGSPFDWLTLRLAHPSTGSPFDWLTLRLAQGDILVEASLTCHGELVEPYIHPSLRPDQDRLGSG